MTKNKPEVLLVDDNPADIDLTSEILAGSKRHFHVNSVTDGQEALCFLRHDGQYAEKPMPDLIVLDLNLPGMDGRCVLQQLKSDRNLSKIPVVIFTSSVASSDVMRCYELGANCYLKKPGNLPEFKAVVQSMADFWLGYASLPKEEKR